MAQLTVLMTTYNEELNIFKQAIESIQNQTFKDFELLIIVDNKNNKEIIEMIEHKSKSDKRIKYLINDENIGLPNSLNKGIDLIETKYIARMDADDVADQNRLKVQIDYARKNETIDLFGANIIYTNYNDDILYKRDILPNDSYIIKKAMKYVNIFNHPTFFGKTEVFKKIKYRNLRYSQDYDFTCRLLEKNYKLSNINDYLLYYRMPKNINDEKKILQCLIYYCIQKNYCGGNLDKVNINEQVKAEIDRINKKKIIKAINYYEKAFENLKKKKYFYTVGFLIYSFLLSKYHRRQLLNLLKYYKIKNKLK